jgi:hypothetical protein
VYDGRMYYLAAKRCCDNEDVKLGELLSSPPPHTVQAEVYILENTSPPSRRGNNSRCHLREKYEKVQKEKSI